MNSMTDLIRVFIGYDTRQAALFNVAQHSIIRHCSKPVSIVPIKLSHLRGIFERERLAIQSTEFSFSRFLTPYLCGYQGWAVFLDCDVILRGDLAELWALRDDRFAVQCVKHDHQPTSSMKFLGEQQTKYAKKNWSSVMLMNCPKCTTLTPDYVNTASGLNLHQFKWLESEGLIGEIPRAWNFLVDYYAHDEAAKLLHYTSGGPYYADYRHVDFAEDWFDNYRDANQTADSDYLALTGAARQKPT